MANYLYNGIELPQLPEWDTEIYPYAFITLMCYAQKYLLTVSTRPGYLFGKESLYNGMCMTSGRFFQYTYDVDTDSWALTRGDDGKYGFELHNENRSLTWCNENVVTEDSGEIYFAASDPIPVNPAPTIDPTALLMCWQVGNRIRQRGGA